MFIITERQYNIIMKQAQAGFPQETGGVLGGREGTILGVLPIANKNLSDRTKVFSLNSDDVDRANQFLAKHQLEYMGLYHTHPKGVPYPSEQDLSHNQKYLFIIGLRDRYNPELRAWKIEDSEVLPENIKIVSDIGVTVVDIKTGMPKLSQNLTREEMDKLVLWIDNWISGKEPEYPRMGPIKWDASSFSTMA